MIFRAIASVFVCGLLVSGCKDGKGPAAPPSKDEKPPPAASAPAGNAPVAEKTPATGKAPGPAAAKAGGESGGVTTALAPGASSVSSVSSPPGPPEGAVVTPAGASPAGAPPPGTREAGGMIKSPTGLEYEVLQPGQGASPPLGSKVLVHFTGTLPDGKRFWDTRASNTPKELKLDRSTLISGWVEALLTMKQGEKRRLKVPSSLAYGVRGYPGLIRPNTDLSFELELVSFKPPGR